MSYKIREATSSDVNDLNRLWIKLSLDQMSKEPYYTGELKFEGDAERFKKAVQNPACGIFVCEVDGSTEGFVEVWLKDSDYYFFDDDYAYILHFFVDENARKNTDAIKIIHGLFKAAEKWAVGKNRKYLEADVFEANKRVIKLLQYVGMNVFRSRMVKSISDESGAENETADQ